jgi:hypothetical protein
MPLFTWARHNADDDTNVTTVITATNRALEAKFPECTLQIVDSGGYGTPSQWVTVDLDFTAQTLPCLEWYATELASKGVVLQNRVIRSNQEPSVTEARDFDLLISHAFDRRTA